MVGMRRGRPSALRLTTLAVEHPDPGAGFGAHAVFVLEEREPAFEVRVVLRVEVLAIVRVHHVSVGGVARRHLAECVAEHR